MGEGAFMNSIEDAIELSELMVSIAELAGRKAVALISDMNQPLGIAVGNALEVKEAIKTLHGGGPEDFREHCLVIASHMLALGGRVDNIEEGKSAAIAAIENGRAWEKFRILVGTQGGDVHFIDSPGKLPIAPIIEVEAAPQSGYITEINAQIVGNTAVQLGAGRSKKGETIDHAVGIEILRNVGDYLKKSEDLFIIHANDESSCQDAKERLLTAHSWSEQPVERLPLFYEMIS
jgi:pyrimidine-nucleoside phosphorylase